MRELAHGAEIVYAGGGNAMLVFESDEIADAFARQITRRTLERARGLELVVKRRPFDPQQPLTALHQQLREELAQRKRDHTLSRPWQGWESQRHASTLASQR